MLSLLMMMMMLTLMRRRRRMGPQGLLSAAHLLRHTCVRNLQDYVQVVLQVTVLPTGFKWSCR